MSYVLVVEDCPDQRSLVRSILQTVGLPSRGVSDGLEALETIASDPPELIISDIRMPNMSGIELCQRLKSQPHTCHIPIVLCSGESPDSLPPNVIHHANAYLQKPYRVSELIEAIQRLCQVRTAALPSSSSSRGIS